MLGFFFKGSGNITSAFFDFFVVERGEVGWGLRMMLNNLEPQAVTCRSLIYNNSSRSSVFVARRGGGERILSCSGIVRRCYSSFQISVVYSNQV